ncbi:uncharacterized protein METZ01_LOCUS143856, partial [marine metagenome]
TLKVTQNFYLGVNPLLSKKMMIVIL